MKTISVLSANLQKSYSAQNAMLKDRKALSFDVIAIQEPWLNSKIDTTNNPDLARANSTLIWPPAQEKDKARTCIFINKRIPRSRWIPILTTRDVTAVGIKLETDPEDQEESTLVVWSVYNGDAQGGSPAVELITDKIDAVNDKLSGHVEHLIVGDFNLHHPIWGGDGIEPDRPAMLEPLLGLMGSASLQSMLRPGTTTWAARGTKSTIDLSLGSPGVQERLIRCVPRETFNYGSDHTPIETTLDLQPLPEAPIEGKHNWKLMDEKLLVSRLREMETFTEAENTEQLDDQVMKLIQGLTGAIEASTPRVRPSKYAVTDFDIACKAAVNKKRKLHRKARAQIKRGITPSARTMEKYRNAVKHAGRQIKTHNRDLHRRNVEDAAGDMGKVAKLAKWAKNTPTPFRPYTPPIRNEAGFMEFNPSTKATLLAKSFFPSPPEADLGDIDGYVYPDEGPCPEISYRELRRAVEHSSPDKAPGPDGITSKVLKKAFSEISDHLLLIFNACIRLGHNPHHFKESLTISLKKPNKGDYTTPKAYRPIALLSTIGKLMESIVAERLSHLVETITGVLPSQHFGGRKTSGTETAMHMLLERIHTAWEQGKIASLLLLDVSGAFDNVSHQRLLHNLRKRKVNSQLVNWISSFISGRRTKVVLPEHTTDWIAVETGIPQGSPLSPILYLFYNADLIEMTTDEERGTTCSGYIDDASILAIGNSAEENCVVLREMHERAKGWAKTHASVFAPAKYELIHFHKTRLLAALDLGNGIQLEPKAACRILGVIFDHALTFRAHLAHIEKTTIGRLGLLSSLAASTWGLHANDLRTIVETTILPQTLYGASVWHRACHNGRTGFIMREREFLRSLTAIQRRACTIVSGGFRTTAGAAQNAELVIKPMAQRLKERVVKDVARITTTTAYEQILKARIPHSNPAKASPLEKTENMLSTALDFKPGTMEIRRPYTCPPWADMPHTHIENNKLLAEQHHNEIRNEIRRTGRGITLYTDGSGINGQVGTAAVCPELGAVRRAYLGTMNKYTVYTAELFGIFLAMEIIKDIPTSDRRDTPIHIFTDNQGAVMTVHEPKPTSGQYITGKIANIYQDIGQKVTIHWVPAHIGIPGNEWADKEAKRATGWRDRNEPRAQPAPTPDDLKQLLSSAKRAIANLCSEEWYESWENSKNGRHLARYLPKPDKATLKQYAALTRAEGSILFQVRTGKIGLNDYLYRIKAAQSAICDYCGNSRQTASHLVMECTRHGLAELRAELWPGGMPANFTEMIAPGSIHTALTCRFLIRAKVLGQFRAVEA